MREKWTNARASRACGTKKPTRATHDLARFRLESKWFKTTYMMLCVVLVTVITSMMYFDYVFWKCEWQECLFVVTSRTHNSLLIQYRKGRHLRPVRGAVSTSIQHTQFQRLVIRSRVCRIERTPSRTKRCQRWALDAPTRRVMVLDDAALALGGPLLCAITSVN